MRRRFGVSRGLKRHQGLQLHVEKCTAEGRIGEETREKENKGETGMDEFSKGKEIQKTSDGRN